MNPGLAEFLRARPKDRRDVFLGAANRLGTPEQNIEKDFWVTWTLDVLSMACPLAIRAFSSKKGLRCPRPTG